MKTVDRRSKERVLHCWRRLLVILADIGPESDRREDLEAFGSVKDYMLDRVEELEILLTKHAQQPIEKRGRKSVFSPLKKNSLRLPDNPADNQSGRETENV